MASVDVYCKINESSKTISSSNKLIVNGNKIVNDDGSTDFTFREIFANNTKSSELYSNVFEQLTNYFLGNYNACLVLMGTQENIKPFLVRTSEPTETEPVLINHIVEHLYNAFMKQRDARGPGRSQSNASIQHTGKDELHLNMFEVMEGQIKDLIVMAHSATSQISVIDNPEVVDDDFDGVHVRNLKSFRFTTLTLNQIQNKILKAMKESQLNKTQAKYLHPLVLEFSLEKYVDGFSVPLMCWFRIFVIPYHSNDNNNNAASRMSTSPPVFDSLLDDVTSGKSNFDSNISAHALKALMSDPLGGNCLTKALITVDSCVSHRNNQLLNSSLLLNQVFNYPVTNTPHVKGLLSQLRKKVKSLDKQLSKDRNVTDAFIDELKEQIQLLDTNNYEIRNKKKEVETLFEDLKEKYNKVVATHSELSSKSVLSTAEKLKLSKESVELKMRANKLQQEAEKQVFELKNKLLAEQESKCKLERSLAYERKLHEDLKEKHQLLKKDNDDVCEEYINLKSNYQTMTNQFQEQAQINVDLNAMVKKLSFRKEQLTTEKSDLEIQQIKEFNEKLQKLSQAISSSGKMTPSKLPPSSVKLESRADERDGIEKLRETHFNELQQLEDKLFSLKRKVQESEEVIASYKQRLVQVTSKMLMIQDNKDSADTSLLEMETMLKQLSEEYKTRLENYVQDVKEFVANNVSTMDATSLNENCLEQIENMVKGIDEYYKNNETLHEKKVKNMTSSYNHVLNQHERVLIAYRLALHESGKKKGEINDEITSYEVFLPDSDDIKNYNTRERNEMRTQLCIADQRVKDLEETVQTLRERVKNQEATLMFKGQIGNDGTDSFPWSGIQKKIQDYSLNVQRNLEKEKVELMTRCHLAEQGLQECQNHMQNGFMKYEQEIIRLKQLLNGYDQQFQQQVSGNLQMQGQQSNARFLPPIEPNYSHHNHRPNGQNRPVFNPDFRR